MGGFIVERYWPGVTEADVRVASAALHRATLPDGTAAGPPGADTEPPGAAAGPPSTAGPPGTDAEPPGTDAEPAGAAGRRPGGVRYLGGILLPGDEVVLFRFEAPDAGLVEAVGVRAGLRCDRVLPAMFLD